MLGWVDDDLRDALGIDVTAVFPRGTLFGFRNENWREIRVPWGQTVLVPEDFRITTDAAGDWYIYPCGDMSAPASGHMPANGYFFDSIIRQPPIDDDKLDPADNLEEFQPVTDDDLNYLKRALRDASATGCAVMAGIGGAALGDIALVPAPFLRHPKGIRDIEEWYVSILTRQDYVHKKIGRAHV